MIRPSFGTIGHGVNTLWWDMLRLCSGWVLSFDVNVRINVYETTRVCSNIKDHQGALDKLM